MAQTQDVFSAMQVGEPLARYVKTIVGKVSVTALDPFSEEPVGVILFGDQRVPEPTSYIELWNPKSLVFFQRLNKAHIDAGRLKEMPIIPQAKPSPNVISDEEINKILDEPFFTLKYRVAQFTTEAPVLRVLNRAREMDKSEKIIRFLEGELAQREIEKVGG